ncbi:MAG: MarR family transcriptional regulator [Streptosporangiaceae bacterium]
MDEIRWTGPVDGMTGCPGTGHPEPDEQLIHEFGLLLSATNRLSRIAGRAFEHDAGITHAMFEMLRRLNEGCSSMSHLAEEMIFTSGGVTRLIDRMDKAGLVVRYTSATDRRIQQAGLTDKGRETLARAERIHVETLRRAFAGPLTDEQRAALKQILVTLEHSSRAELPNLG